MTYQIGKFYMVQSVYAERWFEKFTGWVPVIGPKHEDAELINFPAEHWHVDWRFAGEHLVSALLKLRFNILEQCDQRLLYAYPVQEFEQGMGGRNGRKIVKEIGLRRMKCKREWPDFPRDRAVWQPRLMREFACTKMKNMRCPHRGIPLDTVPAVDGVITCPGHGLRWNITTGELVTA